MIIVHLLAPARAGGLERVVQGLSIGQRDRGHHVVVATITQESMAGHPFRAPLDRAGIEVRELTVPGRGYGDERRAVVSLCRELGADVVHSHGYRPDVVDGGAIRKMGVPTVSTIHGWTRGPWRNRLYEYLHRLALRRFDAVIAVSQPMATQLAASGVSSSRIHVVQNAWSPIAEPVPRSEARSTLALEGNAQIAGWIGRMSREKGIDVLVDAMIRLRDTAIIACAVGDGPERALEEARATDALGSQMRWPGMVDEAGRLCRAFDVFVLSSRTEGIPIALLEAMAAGTPLVVTKVGGVPDVVSDREALLVPSERPDLLADAIAEVFANPAAAAERVEGARVRLATAFGRDRWLDQHDEIYTVARKLRQSASGRRST